MCQRTASLEIGVALVIAVSSLTLLIIPKFEVIGYSEDGVESRFPVMYHFGVLCSFTIWIHKQCSSWICHKLGASK
uniref:Uncharacterized protein n=1 Tax=Rhodnius prolixus TaxID=13249 RepID=T1I1V1_RHOPR